MEDNILLDDHYRSLSISNQASDGLFTLQLTKANEVLTIDLTMFELDEIVNDLIRLKEDLF